MPNTKQVKKRVRQNEKRRVRNVSTKSALKTSIKKFEAAVKSGDKEQVDTNLKRSLVLIDRAGRKRVIHSKTASRKKSAVMKKAHSSSTSS